jgi:sigma54-dependent transcription regulator
VGSDREVPVDVRVLAATNRDLAAAVEQGRFREDLFYRLKVMTVRVPPLREHPEDIAFLAETFLQRQATEAKKGPQRLTRAALARLEQLCSAIIGSPCRKWVRDRTAQVAWVATLLWTIEIPGGIIAKDHNLLP